MIRKKILILFSFLFILASCNEMKPYTSGGFGSVNGGGIGNTGSLVTISGKVMSTATFNSSSLMSLMGLHSSHRTLAGGGVIMPIIDDCASAPWTMSYVGGGNRTIATGTADGDGDFSIPSIPSGKEGIIIFTCVGKTQRCLAKAGDAGISCNSIADGVVGALESTLGKALSSSDLSGKTMAKMASSIVEATNSDDSDSETLKEAMQACEVLPQTNASQKAIRNACFKNSLEASSQAGTLEVVKTLASSWTVRSLFNFVVSTAGYSIEMDSMIYTDFGEAFDDWLQTDFVAKTQEYIQDLLVNPQFVEGDSTKGEHVVKLECKMWYSKFTQGGEVAYTPTKLKLDGTANPTCATLPCIPSCYNEVEIENITGFTPGGPKAAVYAAIKSAIENGEWGNFQFGVPGDLNGDDDTTDPGEAYVDYDRDNDNNPATGMIQNCPNGMGDPGSFCVGMPSLMVKSKMTETNRNDLGGMNSSAGGWKYQPRTSLIEIFPAVETAIGNIMDEDYDRDGVFDSLGAGQGEDSNGNGIFDRGPQPGCITVASGEGTPIVNFASPSCVIYARGQFRALRSEFSGLLGLYNFLKNPSYYTTAGASAKLSLNDIHRLFSKKDFLNVKLMLNSFGSYSQATTTDTNMQSPAVVDLTGAFPFVENYFIWGHADQASFDQDALEDVSENASLLPKPELTFDMFKTLPTTTEIQAFVQGASHHEEWNPFGSRYNWAIADKTATNGDLPVLCRMINRQTDIAMVKELNPLTRIECIADPYAAGVRESLTTEGLFSVPSTLSYPYILMPRGWNGDGKGKLFTLGDRKTGQSIMVGGREIYILEASNGNDGTIMAGGYTCPGGFAEPGDLVDAPVIKAKVNYGSGDHSKSEMVSAYCADLSPFLVSDNETRLYDGGEVTVVQNNNGQSQTFNMRLVGGQDTNVNNFAMDSVCLFADTAFIEFNTTYGHYHRKNSETTFVKQMINTNFTLITTLPAGNVVDFCSKTSNYPTKTQYYLTQHYENGTTYDALNTSTDWATNPNARAFKPVTLLSYTDKTNYWGVFLSVGAIEAASPGGDYIVANSTGTTWGKNIRLLNQRHDPKFDPYCDDKDDDGCDCFVGATATLKDRTGGAECTLLDSTAESTLSNPPYWPGSPGANKAAIFFETYGNKAGAQLLYDDDPNTVFLETRDNNLPAGPDPLDGSYFFSSGFYLNFDDVFICQHLKTGETSYRRPTQIIHNNFASLNHPGCPDAGGTLAAATGWTGPNPNDGGGPIRVVNPKPMNNAFDIEKPRTFLALMSFATKTVGQGRTISDTEKLFSFDEALALISARMLLPQKDIAVEAEGGGTIPGASVSYYPVRLSQDGSEVSPIGAVLKGLTKPIDLALPD